MKKYKRTNGTYSSLNSNDSNNIYYYIKLLKHGLFFYRNHYAYNESKGYYNMGMEYGHWLESKMIFKYYL